MWPTLIRRFAATSRSQLAGGAGQFKLKKNWPPDFSKLSRGEQLRFEKRYKRRLRLMGARPRWNKMLKLAQLFSITFVVVYGVLFMQDSQSEREPFADFRKWFWGLFGANQEPRRLENVSRGAETDTADRPERSR